MAFYHSCSGEYHGAVITEEADDLAGLAGAWISEAAGHLKVFKSMQVYTPEETMEALGKAGGSYLRGPSGGS